MNTKIIGNEGETLASKYIENKGIKIIDKNFFTRYGEIDIIGVNNDVVYFFEVKYRNNKSFGFGEEAISSSKIRKLRQSIEIWTTQNLEYIYHKKYLNGIIISPENQILEFEIL